MKVGVFTVILRSMPLEQALDYLASLGVQTVEIGTGAYPGIDHCDADALLASDAKANEFLHKIESRGLKISCLSVHGNPIHPNGAIAQDHDAAFQRCVRLAARLAWRWWLPSAVVRAVRQAIVNLTGSHAPGHQSTWISCDISGMKW